MKLLTVLIFSIFISTLASFAQKPSILITEIMALNNSTITDESGKYEDWIELYNAGDKTVDIGGMYMTDDSDDPKQHKIPEGDSATLIYPGSYLLLWADDDIEEGVLHIEFKLSKDGEYLALYDHDGETLIDSVYFSRQNANVSFGRNPEQPEKWQFFDDPTPGSKNR